MRAAPEMRGVCLSGRLERAVAGPRHAGAGAEIEGRRGDPGLRTQDQVDGRHGRMVARVPGDLSSRRPPRSACGGKFAAGGALQAAKMLYLNWVFSLDALALPMFARL